MSRLSRPLQPQRRPLVRHRAQLLLIAFGVLLVAGVSLSPASRAQSPSDETSGTLIAQQTTPTPGGLQRGTVQNVGSANSARALVCQRQLANLDRNGSTWSWVGGAFLFVFFIYLLTASRRMRTYSRLFVAVGASVLLGPALLALVIRESLKACPDPPGFFDSLFIPVLLWTIAGSVSVAVILALFRWLFVVRREFSER
jgi:hypothetical protein